MKVYIVYRKGPEWCDVVNIWSTKLAAECDIAWRNSRTAKAKTSKERLSVYTVKAHTVRGGGQ